jgi:hypothetical protein
MRRRSSHRLGATASTANAQRQLEWAGEALAALGGWSGECGEFHPAALPPGPEPGHDPNWPSRVWGRAHSWALIGLLVGTVATPRHVEAQSARTVITATATVAAEVTYHAFSGAQEALARGRVEQVQEWAREGLLVKVQEEKPRERSARPSRIVWIYFAGN